MKDPGLVHLVLGEANRVEEAASKVAVDHSHGSVAKHEGENAPLVDFLQDLVGDPFCRRAHRR